MQPLSWSLVDRRQKQLATFSHRRAGSKINVGINLPRTGTLELAIEDPDAKRTKPGETFIKTLLWDAPVFIGRVVVPDFKGQNTGDDPDSLTVGAVDPSYSIARRFTKSNKRHHVHHTRPDDSDINVAVASDQSLTMMWLMEYADVDKDQTQDGIPRHGIIPGALPPQSVLRPVSSFSDGSNVWDLIVQIASLADGPDFEIEPFNATNGDLARFNIFYPRQGKNRVGTVKLEYGVGTENVDTFNYQPSGEQLCNRFTAIGAANKAGTWAPAWTSESFDSQKKYGLLEDVEVLSDVRKIDTLHAYAKGQVAQRAYPIDFIELTMIDDGSVRPRFGPGAAGNFWIGDIVAVRAKNPEGLNIAPNMRVTDAELTEQDDGAVEVKLTLADASPTPGIVGFQTLAYVGGV